MKFEPTKDMISPLAWSICKAINQKEQEAIWPNENTSLERCLDAFEVDCALSEIKAFVEAAAPLLASSPPFRNGWSDSSIKWADWASDLSLQLTAASEHEGGWVYFIRCNEYTKIGLSNDVESRLKGLQTASPYPLILETKFAASEPEYIERFLHQWFSEKRVSGEWFALSEFDILQIKSWGSAHLLRMARSAEAQGPDFFAEHRRSAAKYLAVEQEPLSSAEVQ